MAQRDEFLSPIRKALAERSGFRCSYLGCSNATVGPSEESETAVARIGVACHISAAAPGGKRYNPKISPEERASISNGIWMCATHSVEIDRDEVRYTVEILKHWKKVAETKAEYAKNHGWGIFDNNDFFPIENLAEVNLNLTTPSNSNERIGNAILDSCLPYIWGEKQSTITRDLIIELYRNAFDHGKATKFEIEISAKKVQLKYDGDEFNIFNLLSHNSADGGADTLNEIIINHRNDFAVNYIYTQENLVTLHTIKDFSELSHSLPCIVKINEHDPTKTVGLLDIHEKCGAIYIMLPMHFCRSDVRGLESSLSAIEPTGKPVFIVGSNISDNTKRAIIGRFPTFTFIQK